MTPPFSTDSLRQDLLEEVLEEYMRRLDHGEAVDRDQFLAQHPTLADELRSYFAGIDEVEQLHRPVGSETGVLSPSRSLPETGELPLSSGEGRYVGDYELLEEIARGRHGGGLQGPAGQPQPPRRPQDDPRRIGWPRRGRAALPERGRGGGQPGPPEHRADLRGRRARGPALLQHEADRGRQPRPAARPA